jgi:two-component system LytT family response regulator
MAASDGEMAVRMILSERPDLVLLDVQMPELNGMEVVDKIGAERMPLTVFVTAYDQHAIRAFEANALDYLLKPFSDERLEATLTRVKTRLDELHLREFGKSVAQVMATSQAPRGYWDRLAVKSEESPALSAPTTSTGLKPRGSTSICMLREKRYCIAPR